MAHIHPSKTNPAPAMNKNVRIVLAVVLGWLLYGIVWNLVAFGMSSIFPDTFVMGEPLSDTLVLVIYLVLSIPVSVLAGFAAARFGMAHAGTAVKALAIVNLVTGIAVQAMSWNLFPAWWHILFLLFVVPATLYGGSLVRPKAN